MSCGFLLKRNRHASGDRTSLYGCIVGRQSRLHCLGGKTQKSTARECGVNHPGKNGEMGERLGRKLNTALVSSQQTALYALLCLGEKFWDDRCSGTDMLPSALAISATASQLVLGRPLSTCETNFRDRFAPHRAPNNVPAQYLSPVCPTPLGGNSLICLMSRIGHRI